MFDQPASWLFSKVSVAKSLLSRSSCFKLKRNSSKTYCTNSSHASLLPFASSVVWEPARVSLPCAHSICRKMSKEAGLNLSLNIKMAVRGVFWHSFSFAWEPLSPTPSTTLRTFNANAGKESVSIISLIL